MKLVRESAYNFHKTGDVRSSLGIGRVTLIKTLFDQLDIPESEYKITDTEVIFPFTLDLRGSSVAELPDGLRIRGDLVLGRTQIMELPKRLKITRGLYLDKTPIEELPEDIVFGGSLFLRRSNIKKLPDGLSVEGNLGLSGTPIASLPEGLSVKRDLYLNKTLVVEIPEDLNIGGAIVVDSSQKELISFIESSKFRKKLSITYEWDDIR